MEITHYSNSFLSISSGKTKLVCDPWVGTTSENSWISDPIHYNGDKIVNNIKPQYIYISHLHCDHLDEKLLKRLLDKKVCIIIKKFKIPTLKNRIKNAGFKKILELKEWTVKDLNKDLSISIVPQITNNNDALESEIHYDLDTSIIIRCNKTNKIFYNNVDNPININQFKRIKKFVKNQMNKEIDICTFNVGAASEYPQCFLNINRTMEKKKLVNKCLNDAKKKVNILNAKAFFPSGGSYKISGKYFNLNKFRAIPEFSEIFNKVSKEKFKCYDLLGGHSLIVDINGFRKKNKKFQLSLKDQKIKNLKYPYENKDTKFNLNEINYLYYQSLENYFKRIQKFNINHSWEVNFLVFKNLTLNKSAKIDYDKSSLIEKYELDYGNEGKKYFLDIFLDSKLFYDLLRRKISWNAALSGSLILFKRKPNIFVPDLPFSLNFLTI
ncbi:MAG: hypothetical protein CMI71_01075 [Candidatus Pelagibacter sp.]|nr:hypothetical protein [Candidatus Pelagibacter sp.]